MAETARSARLTLALAVVAALWAASAWLSLSRLQEVMQSVTSVPALAAATGPRGLFFVAVSLLLLWLSGDSAASLGLAPGRRQGGPGRAAAGDLAAGAGLGLALFAIHTLALQPVLTALLPADARAGVDMAPLFASRRDLPLWLLLAVFKGGFSEELWRATAVTRFERRLGRPGLMLALAASSCVFGVAHLYQGLDGALGSSLLGLVFALIYLRRRRLLEPIAAHAAFDVLSILMGYAFLSP